MFKKKNYLMLVAVSCLLLFLCIIFVAHNALAQQKLVAAGGGVGGAWYITMAGLAEIAKEKGGIDIKVVPGGGLANPARIGSGEINSGLGSTVFVAAARAGEAPYKTSYPDLRVAAVGFSGSMLHVSADEEKYAKVDSIDGILKTDFPLKMVCGRASSLTTFVFTQLLDF